jgi:putative hydrolases of HD superfamily
VYARLSVTAPALDAMPWPEGRLGQQLRFLLEIDRLKAVARQTAISDGSRQENSAEHSWHLAMCAMVLAEHAGPELDVARAVAMAVVHDIVEIDAGDTFIYDAAGQVTKEAREREAAVRIFGLLPDDQARWMRELWEEFERRESREARFAAALDRLAPVMLNFATQGHSWRRHAVPASQVRAVNAKVGDASPELGAFVQTLITEAVAQGWLEEG